MAPPPTPSPLASASPLNLPSSSTRASSSIKQHNATSMLPSHETHMLFLGQACHLSTCRREDFLPFHCPSCGNDYCSRHRLPHPTSEQGGHSCDFHLQPEKASNGDQGDFLVPLCPLCTEPPKGWKRGEDPDVAMDRHLTSGDCPELMGEAGKGQSRRIKKPNECSLKRCHKLMIVQMVCEKCAQSFCPSHRAPAQHQCGVSNPQQAKGAGNGGPLAKDKVGDSHAVESSVVGGLTAFRRWRRGSTDGSSKSGPASTPATAPIATLTSKSESAPPASPNPPSTSITTAKPAASKDTLQQDTPSPSSVKNSGNIANNIFGFSISSGGAAGRKVDKRAQSERHSQLRSLQTRRQRGFKLSAAEEVKLAELSAELGVADGGSRKGLQFGRGGGGGAAKSGGETAKESGVKGQGRGGGFKSLLKGWGS